MEEKTILEFKDITKEFPGVRALDGVSFKAVGGEVTGLIGVNGAGKSTLMNILGGIHPATTGSIHINGEEVAINTPQDAEDLGIGFIHQEPVMFNYMTVAENISLSKMQGRVNYKEINAVAEKYLSMMDGDIKPTDVVGNLPIGDRQMVQIARALSTGGKILLFDEPTASFAYREKEKLFEVIRGLKKQGAAIFFISHFLDEVEEITDRTVVLRDGKVVLDGKTEEIPRSEVLVNMVGGKVAQIEKETAKEDSEVVCRVRNLTVGRAPRNVSFDMHRGEVLGIWGLMGSGRTEVLRAMYGLDKVDEGEIAIRDSESGELKVVSFEDVREYCGYVTEARHDDGLFLPWTIWQNIASPNLKRFKKKNSMFLDFRAQKQKAEKYFKQLNVKAPNINVRLEQLSGGNQQKVVMAKWLLRHPQVFLLDEPTRGVDVGAKAEIHQMVLDLAQTGTSILLISSEIEEISSLSDRLLVLNRGEIVAEVGKEDIDKELLMSYCV